MYTKISVVRSKVKVTTMEKMNVMSRGKRSKAPVAASSEEKEKRYYYNQLRKRKEIINLIAMNFKENASCFITLTIADGTVEPKQVTMQFEKFTKRMRRIYDHFRYVATAEYQDRGELHYHLICNIIDEMDATDSIIRCWNNGGIDVQKVYNVEGLALYMTKEFIQQNRSSPLFGKRCYKTSQKLDKPFEVNSWEMSKEDFKTLKNAIILGTPEKEKFVYNEKAGNVSYSTYSPSPACDGLFGEYVFAVKR